MAFDIQSPVRESGIVTKQEAAFSQVFVQGMMVDLLARYSERLMRGENASAEQQGVTEALLRNSGLLD